MTNNAYKKNHADTTRALDLERRYRLALEREHVPPHLHAGMIRYFVYRIQTGGFLKAALENNLYETLAMAARALTAEEIRALATFIETCAPPASHGSSAAVTAWLADLDTAVPDPPGAV